MSDHHGSAGQSTRDMAGRRSRALLWLGLIVLAGVVLLWVVVSKSSALGIGASGLMVLLLVARFLLDFAETRGKRLRKEERRATRGARAEEKIGTLLAELGEGYLVIHDVQSPYGNIDHVVISKGGIFVIETKSHGGRVSVADGRLRVNGRETEKDFIAQALKNTYWLRDTIRNACGVEAWITPILVFTNAYVEGFPRIKGVTVVNKRYLLSNLQRTRSGAPVWERRQRVLDLLRKRNFPSGK